MCFLDRSVLFPRDRGTFFLLDPVFVDRPVFVELDRFFLEPPSLVFFLDPVFLDPVFLYPVFLDPVFLDPVFLLPASSPSPNELESIAAS